MVFLGAVDQHLVYAWWVWSLALLNTDPFAKHRYLF